MRTFGMNLARRLNWGVPKPARGWLPGNINEAFTSCRKSEPGFNRRYGPCPKSRNDAGETA